MKAQPTKTRNETLTLEVVEAVTLSGTQQIKRATLASVNSAEVQLQSLFRGPSDTVLQELSTIPSLEKLGFFLCITL